MLVTQISQTVYSLTGMQPKAIGVWGYASQHNWRTRYSLPLFPKIGICAFEPFQVNKLAELLAISGTA